MRLTVLGGASASPNTGMGCSGYLLESGDTWIWVDPGPGTLLELRKYADFRALSAVIASHLHLDHLLDLLAWRHALAYNPVRPARPTPVYLSPGGIDFLRRATAPFDESDEPGTFDRQVEMREFDPELALQIGEIEIRFLRTMHYLPAWAMRFRAASGASIGFTADAGPTTEFGDFFAGVDLLLAEATLLEAGDRQYATRGSLTAEEAGQLAHASSAKQLVLTHYWEELGPDALLKAASRTFVGPIALARPGLRIDVQR
jgi:ribonuclease BN (tRNA processing enzyme)